MMIESPIGAARRPAAPRADAGLEHAGMAPRGRSPRWLLPRRRRSLQGRASISVRRTKARQGRRPL